MLITDYNDEGPFLWVNQEGQLVVVDMDEGDIFLCKGLKEIWTVDLYVEDIDYFWLVDHIATLPISLIEKMFKL